MSEATIDALESEAYEGEAFGDAYEGEASGEASWDGEDSRSRAYRRARQRQIMLARQRRAQLRPWSQQPRVVRPTPAVRPDPATIDAIRSVDLDAKVAQDATRRALEQADRRASRALYSALATGAVSQALDTYQDNLKEHSFVRAAARWAPLAILPADRNRKGIEAVALHPAFVSGALIGGIFLVGRFTTTPARAHDLRLAVPSVVQVDSDVTLVAVPVDRNGRTVSGVAVTWTATPSGILDPVDAAAGKFRAVDVGPVVVRATADTVDAVASITVERFVG